MLQPNITLGDGYGADINFVSVQSKDGIAKRVDDTAPLNAPRAFVISHDETKNVHRHLVKSTRESQDATHESFVSVNLTINVPDDLLITESEVVKALGPVICFLTGNNDALISIPVIKSLLRGES